MRSLNGILFGSGPRGGFWSLIGVGVEVGAGVDEVAGVVVKDRRKACIVRFFRQLVQMFLVFMVNWCLYKSGIEDGAFCDLLSRCPFRFSPPSCRTLSGLACAVCILGAIRYS